MLDPRLREDDRNWLDRRLRGDDRTSFNALLGGRVGPCLDFEGEADLWRGG